MYHFFQQYLYVSLKIKIKIGCQYFLNLHYKPHSAQLILLLPCTTKFHNNFTKTSRKPIQSNCIFMYLNNFDHIILRYFYEAFWFINEKHFISNLWHQLTNLYYLIDTFLCCNMKDYAQLNSRCIEKKFRCRFLQDEQVFFVTYLPNPLLGLQRTLWPDLNYVLTKE